MNIRPLEDTYQECLTSGRIREMREVDSDLIRSLKTAAEAGLAFIKDKTKYIKKDSTEWTFVFRHHYESLRSLIEAYLLFDRIEAEKHQCKNAFLCFKHPELELNWSFLETIRLKRNAINYRGLLLTYGDWKQFELGFELHIGKLREEIEERLLG